MKYVFFGGDDFSEIVLGVLKKNGFIPQLVVNSGEELKALVDKISETRPDLFIIASFGKILPENFLNIPKKGVLNVHPSLLPELRGPSPIQTALLEGRKTTGVTVILADEKVDHGPILGQEEVFIGGEDNYESLLKKLAKTGGKLLAKIIPLWLENKIKPAEQDHARATYTKLFAKEDGKIDWNDSSEKILNQIRAFNPWPSAYTFWEEKKGNKKRLIISKAQSFSFKKEDCRPGSIVFEDSALLVKTGEGFLKLLEVKPEGKSKMSGEAFFRGHQYLQGKNFKS